MNVEFNKNLELIFGLLYCVDKDYHTGPENLYSVELPTYCNEFYNMYKKGISDELVEYISNFGFGTFCDTAYIALSLDDEFNIISNQYIEDIKENYNNFDQNKIKLLLTDFTRKCNYEQFYNDHIGLYNKIIEKFNQSMNKYVKLDENLISNFYGYSKGEMNIMLYNFTSGSFGLEFNDNLFYIQKVSNQNDSELNFEFPTRLIFNYFH